MKLIAFRLENYRSIRQSHRLVLGKSLTTLVGPNNEGKSNILRALVAALKMIPRFDQRFAPPARGDSIRLRSLGSTKRLFSWEMDFPLAFQEANPDGATVFVTEFQLTASEGKKMAATIGRNLEGLLSFEIRCTASEWNLIARDEGQTPIAPQHFRYACRLVGQTLTPQYIPSVRTAESAQEIVYGIVRRELKALESKKTYRDAMKAIQAIEKPVLSQLSKAVTETLSVFLPSVKRVRLKLGEREQEEAIRQACSIIVNDGTETDLKQKGDGIQSLAAMSLMRHAALRSAGKRRIILAVEEPETHLHSKAIHQLRNVLNEIAANNQVIITTHNPVFVNREHIGTNILVSANNASPAETTEQIREMLGVRPSDNLRHAEIVLVVEGEDDRLALESLLKHHSKTLRGALTNGVLAIDPLHGSSNLTFKLNLIRTALCSAFVFVDYDVAGKTAVEKALADRVLSKADVKYAMCRGKDESEFEDFYSLTFCEPIVKAVFGVDLVKPLMRGRRKWSDRVGECFKAQGQDWDDATKAAVKAKIAAAVAASPKLALQKATRDPFDALVKALEEKVKLLTVRKA
ncbi:MAG: AAA family ATPase [Verrucomicrobiaceae bacterium]|nr:AAA family ATPase [Verrucomicrobiaceae bacterium]